MQKYIVNDNESGQTLEKYVKKVLKNAPLSFIYKLFVGIAAFAALILSLLLFLA